jgi:UDP-glucuronate 4-epimerase
MKILITGCAGFIGYHTASHLLNREFEIVGVDNFDDYYDKELKLKRLELLTRFKNFKFIKIDVNNIEKINDSNFDILINLAAQAGVRIPENKKEKYTHSNIRGFDSVLGFIKKNNIKKFIYASSSSVYSGLETQPYKEDMALLEPKSIYAQTKIYNENKAREFCLNTECKSIGLRFFTVYGPYGRPDMAYFSFAKKVMSGSEISLFNNGNTYRDMTFIDDIVSGIYSSIEYISEKSFNSEIFNLGNGKPVKTTDMLEIIENKFKKYGKIKYINKTNETTTTHACLIKSREHLGFESKVDIECGMDRFLNWFERYFNI